MVYAFSHTSWRTHCHTHLVAYALSHTPHLMVVFIEDHLKVQSDKLAQVTVCVGVLGTKHWKKWEERRG